MRRSATISECGRYRYSLWREWAEIGDPKWMTYAVFIMLNPSTADAVKDDPTITRCVRFARDWGMGGMVVVNLFAWRATDPRELYSHADEKVGDHNDLHIAQACCEATVVVAAWGVHGVLLRRGEQVRKLVPDLKVLRLTKGGHPAHPLYLPRYLTPMEWAAMPAAEKREMT